MSKGYTVNVEEYCNTLRKLRRNIQNRRRGMLSRGVSLFHDNVRPNQHGADFSGSTHIIRMENRQPPLLFTRFDIIGFSSAYWKSFWVENVISSTTKSSRRWRGGWRGWRERSTTRAYKSWSPDYKNASNLKAIMLKNSLLYYPVNFIEIYAFFGFT